MNERVMLCFYNIRVRCQIIQSGKTWSGVTTFPEANIKIMCRRIQIGDDDVRVLFEMPARIKEYRFPYELEGCFFVPDAASDPVASFLAERIRIVRERSVSERHVSQLERALRRRDRLQGR